MPYLKGGLDIAGNFSDLRKFQQNLDRLQKAQREELFEECMKELATRFLTKVTKRTPVGDYSKEIQYTAKRDSKNHKKGDVYTKKVNPSGKKGGTLRRGWTIGEIQKQGNTYKVEIYNPTIYASYVEYGHRTANHKGFVPGRLMMTISEQQIQQIAPSVLQRKLNKYLEDAFK